MDSNHGKRIEQVFSFSGAIGNLPSAIIEEVKESIEKIPNARFSILAISHRSEEFLNILVEAKENIRKLLNIPDTYHILFLHGGASLQFSMIPINFLVPKTELASYIITGYWSDKAAAEASREGSIEIVWNGRNEGFTRVPTLQELDCRSNSRYLHFCSNETVEGVQFREEPYIEGVPLICDMSSDFMARTFDINRYAMVYAHSQKNLGGAGVTVVLLRKELLDIIPENIHSMLDYRHHVQMNSVSNTPPVFNIYLVTLITRWLLKDIDGIENLERAIKHKSDLVYDAIDCSKGFYRGYASVQSRSFVNVVFDLPNRALEEAFIVEAEARGLYGLRGHRSRGGLRASLFLGMPMKGVCALVEFMQDFRNRYRGKSIT